MYSLNLNQLKFLLIAISDSILAIQSINSRIKSLIGINKNLYRFNLTRGVRLVSDADFFVTLQVKRRFQTMKKKIVFWAIVDI